MKKISALISVLFLGSALSLAACKKDDEKKTDDKAAKQSFVAGIFNEDVQVGAERDLNGETCCRFIDACL